MAASTEEKRPRDTFALLLLAIAVAGLIWRVIYVVWMRELPLRSDGVHYAFAAGYLADGKGYINPFGTYPDGSSIQDAVHPPAWSTVLAIVTKFGLKSFIWYQLTATIVGTGTIIMSGLAAREAFGKRVGLIAAALVAVYPGIWLYERELVSEPLALFGVATIIWLTYRFRSRPGAWRAVALGAVLGLCALTRSEMLMVGVLVITPVILSARVVGLGRRVAWLAIAGACTVAVLSPWFIYNSSRFSRPVPLSVGLGATMKAGNCIQTFEGERIGYYNFGCAIFVNGIDQDPSVADGQFRALALDYISANKKQFLVVAAVRIGRTYSVFSPLQQREFEGERGSPPWVLTVALFSYYALVPLAIWGAIVARRRKVPIYPLVAFFVIAVLVVIPTIGAVRYRAPAEIALVILAAVGIDAVVRAWSRRRAGAVDSDGEPTGQSEPTDQPEPGSLDRVTAAP